MKKFDTYESLHEFICGFSKINAFKVSITRFHHETYDSRVVVTFEMSSQTALVYALLESAHCGEYIAYLKTAYVIEILINK